MADPFATPPFAQDFGESAASSPAISKITINTINTQRVGVAFTVTGTFTFSGDQAVSGLQYADGTGPLKPTHATVMVAEAYTFSFAHPGYAAVGTHTLTVGVPSGVLAKSNAFKVVKA